MAHHYSDLPKGLADEFMKEVTTSDFNPDVLLPKSHEPFGATGKFPEGKLSDNDEGEIRFGVTNYRGKVLIDFGKPVQSIGFTPAQARQIAATLLKHAERAETR